MYICMACLLVFLHVSHELINNALETNFVLCNNNNFYMAHFITVSHINLLSKYGIRY